jgi:hypothetical protein
MLNANIIDARRSALLLQIFGRKAPQQTTVAPVTRAASRLDNDRPYTFAQSGR